MDATTTAKAFGLFFTLFGMGVVTHKHFMRTVMEDVIHHPGLQLIASLFPMLIGSFLVVQYPCFTGDWTCLLTFVGYMILFAGIFRLWFNSTWVDMMHKLKDGNATVYAGIFLIFLGVSLLSFGFDLTSGGATWV